MKNPPACEHFWITESTVSAVASTWTTIEVLNLPSHAVKYTVATSEPKLNDNSDSTDLLLRNINSTYEDVVHPRMPDSSVVRRKPAFASERKQVRSCFQAQSPRCS